MMEWAQYYDAVGDEPRDTLLAALDRFAAPGTAVDLGCGTGRDTFELLRRGWQVVAIDSAAEAISRLRAAAGDDPRLATQVAVYEDAALPECDLVNASWSLPFCRPELFGLIAQLHAALAASRGCTSGGLGDWSKSDETRFAVAKAS